MQHELIEVGEHLTLPFSENASTGYRTYIMPSDGLHIISDTYKIKGKEPGAGSIRESTTSNCNIIKVEVVNNILRLDLYFIEKSIQGYKYKNKFYNINGNPINKPKGSVVSVKLLKYDNQLTYNFYFENGELSYNIGSCLYSAKNSKKINCYEKITAELIGSILLITQKDEHNKILLWFKDNEIVGYDYNNNLTKLVMDPEGRSWSGDYSQEFILPNKVSLSLKFYIWNDQIVYMDDSDQLKCLYNFNGKQLKCSLKGITGKGDGTLLLKINL